MSGSCPPTTRRPTSGSCASTSSTRVGDVGSFTPMPTDGDPDECAARYDRVLREVIHGHGIDLIHLGFGPDGHTASLFSDSPSLDVTDAFSLATEDPSGRNPHPRLTVTYPVIDSARMAVFTVSGQEKHAAIRSAPRRRQPAGRPSGGAPDPLAGRPGGIGRPRGVSTTEKCDGPRRVGRGRPRRADRGRPSGTRPASRPPGDLLAQGLHPAHHAVPGPVRLLHLRQAPGPVRQPVPRPATTCFASPRPAGKPAATRPSSRWANDPSFAIRPRPSGWPSAATHRRSTTWPPCARRSCRRPGCSPTPTRGPSTPTSWSGSGRSRPARG